MTPEHSIHPLALAEPLKFDAATGKPRSPEWPKVRKEHLAKHPNCAACGKNDDPEVHHKMPFHLDESKELDESNLITLCRSGAGNTPCHFLFGHAALSWSCFDPNVVEICATISDMRQHAKYEK